MIWGLKRVFLDLWCGGQYWVDVEFQWSNFHFCVGNMNKWHSTGCGRLHDKTEDPDEDWGVYLKLFLSAQLCHFFFFSQQWSQPGEIHKINNRNRAKSSLNVSLGHPLRTSLSLCNNSSLLLIPETITLQFYQEKSTSHSFHPSFFFFFLNRTTALITSSPCESVLKKHYRWQDLGHCNFQEQTQSRASGFRKGNNIHNTIVNIKKFSLCGLRN